MIGRVMSSAALAAFIFSFALLCALTVEPANAATDPGVACAVAKQKAAAKFDASFVKAEAKGGCVTTSDATTTKTIPVRDARRSAL